MHIRDGCRRYKTRVLLTLVLVVNTWKLAENQEKQSGHH